MTEAWDWLDNAFNDAYDWIMTDSDQDGQVDWALPEIAEQIGDTIANIGDGVGRGAANVINPVVSGLSLPLIIAGVLGVVFLTGGKK